MAKPILPQDFLALQASCPELDHFLRESVNNGVPLRVVLQDAIDGLFDSLYDWRIAIQQALHYGLIKDIEAGRLETQPIQKLLTLPVVIWDPPAEEADNNE